MRTSIVIGLVASSLAVFACDNKKNEAPATPSATATASTPIASATPSASAMPSAQVAKNDKMAHCPAAVEGASTDIKNLKDGVELTITASDPAKMAEIRARAKALADASRNPELQTKHNGAGGGGGQYGRCPIVVKNTDITLADVDNGTKVTVKPKDQSELDWLMRETHEREDSMSAQIAQMDAGAGAKHMEHCPSAVDGASTAVKDSKDGSVLTITGKTADVQKAIRDRAKHVADVMAHDAGAVAHTGEGTGGHNLGRCPEVIKDTSVSSKDIANGAEITVKAKSVNDVLRVQHEVKQRAERFTLQAEATGSAKPAPSASAPPAASAKK